MSAMVILINLLPFIIFTIGCILVFKFVKNPPNAFMEARRRITAIGEILLVCVVLLSSGVAMVLNGSRAGWHPVLAMKYLLIGICQGCDAVMH